MTDSDSGDIRDLLREVQSLRKDITRIEQHAYSIKIFLWGPLALVVLLALLVYLPDAFNAA